MQFTHRSDPVEMEFAFRAMPDGTSTFEGYAAVFNQPSKVIRDAHARTSGGYRETLMPGTFRRTLGSGRRQTFVVDHDERQMVSATPNGPLRLAEDSRGLHVESPWPRLSYTDNVRALHDAGNRLGMSILFGSPKGGEAWNPTGDARTVSDAILKHVSVLATMEPAYDGTVASFRALADMTEAAVEDVDALMEALRDGRRLDEGEYNLLTRLAQAVRPTARSLDDLAAFLLADKAALQTAIDKLANGEPLMAQEAELLEAAIEHLEPPDEPMDMADEAGRALTEKVTAILSKLDSDLPQS
jgi:HK97 family phage prohead protease